MTEELLRKIKEEAKKELAGLEQYNAYAKLRNQLAIVEKVKESFGLPFTRNMYLPEKTEESVIIDAYKKYIRCIENQDTNHIYIYMGTYIKIGLTLVEWEDGELPEIEVDYGDYRATHRYYGNLECLHQEAVKIEDCEDFEKKHTVIYTDNYTDLLKDFIITAIKEDQETAVSKVLKKYNK